MVDLVVDCLSHDSSLEQLKGIWQTLERVDTQCTPFSSWLWANTWWTELRPKNSQLSIVIVKNGQEVVGVCPLYSHTIQHLKIFPMTTLALIGAVPRIQTTHPCVLSHPRFRKLVEIAVMKYLPTLKGWHALELDGIDVESSVAAVARFCLKTRRGTAPAVIQTNIEQENLLCTWKEYQLKGRGDRGADLNHLSKELKALASSSESCELSICSTRHDLNESQDRLYALNRSMDEHGNFPVNSNACEERFFKRVVSEFFLADMLWQVTLKIDAETVGVQHYFIWRGELMLFQGAYAPKLPRPDFARFMLAYAIKRGIGQALMLIRIHSLEPALVSSMVSERVSVAQLRFTPSLVRRVLNKQLKRLKKLKN